VGLGGVGRDHLQTGRLHRGPQACQVWVAWRGRIVQVIQAFPALLEVALVETTGCDDHQHATRFERLEGVRRGSRYVQEIARAELEVLVAELEAVATVQDEDASSSWWWRCSGTPPPVRLRASNSE
jgi:hypothetical protein